MFLSQYGGVWCLVWGKFMVMMVVVSYIKKCLMEILSGYAKFAVFIILILVFMTNNKDEDGNKWTTSDKRIFLRDDKKTTWETILMKFQRMRNVVSVKFVLRTTLMDIVMKRVEEMALK